MNAVDVFLVLEWHRFCELTVLFYVRPLHRCVYHCQHAYFHSLAKWSLFWITARKLRCNKSSYLMCSHTGSIGMTILLVTKQQVPKSVVHMHVIVTFGCFLQHQQPTLRKLIHSTSLMRLFSFYNLVHSKRLSASIITNGSQDVYCFILIY